MIAIATRTRSASSRSPSTTTVACSGSTRPAANRAKFPSPWPGGRSVRPAPAASRTCREALRVRRRRPRPWYSPSADRRRRRTPLCQGRLLPSSRRRTAGFARSDPAHRRTRTVQVARATDRSPHILLVRPAVEDPNREHLCERHLSAQHADDGGIEIQRRAAQVREALVGHVVELLEDLDHLSGPPRVDAALHEPAEVVADVRKVVRELGGSSGRPSSRFSTAATCAT